MICGRHYRYRRAAWSFSLSFSPEPDRSRRGTEPISSRNRRSPSRLCSAPCPPPPADGRPRRPLSWARDQLMRGEEGHRGASLGSRRRREGRRLRGHGLACAQPPGARGPRHSEARAHGDRRARLRAFRDRPTPAARRLLTGRGARPRHLQPVLHRGGPWYRGSPARGRPGPHAGLDRLRSRSRARAHGPAGRPGRARRHRDALDLHARQPRGPRACPPSPATTSRARAPPSPS